MAHKKGKSSLYSITERRVPELIPVLGSQPAGDAAFISFIFLLVLCDFLCCYRFSVNPAVGCHYFPPGSQSPLQPLRGLLPILLLGEQRHDGCEQFV